MNALGFTGQPGGAFSSSVWLDVVSLTVLGLVFLQCLKQSVCFFALHGAIQRLTDAILHNGIERCQRLLVLLLRKCVANLLRRCASLIDTRRIFLVSYLATRACQFYLYFFYRHKYPWVPNPLTWSSNAGTQRGRDENAPLATETRTRPSLK